MNKDMKQFLRRAKRDGWKAELTAQGHVKLTKPGSTIVYVSSKPGNTRAIKNAASDMRRALRRERETQMRVIEYGVP